MGVNLLGVRFALPVVDSLGDVAVHSVVDGMPAFAIAVAEPGVAGDERQRQISVELVGVRQQSISHSLLRCRQSAGSLTKSGYRRNGCGGGDSDGGCHGGHPAEVGKQAMVWSKAMPGMAFTSVFGVSVGHRRGCAGFGGRIPAGLLTRRRFRRIYDRRV